MSVRKSLGLPENKTVFLTVRNLVPRMGIEALIEAFERSALLQKKSLLLIGGEGFLKRSLKTMVEMHGLESVIRFLGRISEDQLRLYYQAVDFFILPTRELEGFGLVILEAMACGTPVLGTPVGAIPELIRPFDSRLLFEGSRSGDMTAKLEDVLLHPELYSFDAQACRRYVEDRFSWERMAAAFEEEMVELLKPSRRMPVP
ncbi:MAG: glycosyltransferase family 4 protein [Thermodesulfobacteriota bacterium]